MNQTIEINFNQDEMMSKTINNLNLNNVNNLKYIQLINCCYLYNIPEDINIIFILNKRLLCNYTLKKNYYKFYDFINIIESLNIIIYDKSLKKFRLNDNYT